MILKLLFSTIPTECQWPRLQTVQSSIQLKINGGKLGALLETISFKADLAAEVRESWSQTDGEGRGSLFV